MQRSNIPIERKVPIALALVLVMLIAPAVSLAGSGGSPNPPPSRGEHLDIAIEGVERVATSVSNNVYPGQKVVIEVRLVHDERPYTSDTDIKVSNGNTFTVVVIVDNDLGEKPGEEDLGNVSTMYKSVTKMPINYSIRDPGTQMSNPYRVAFEWYAPLKPPTGKSWAQMSFKVNAAITVDDDDKSDNFRGGSSIKVSEPDFQPAIHEAEEQKPGVRGMPHSVSVGQVDFFDFELWNEGPAVDIIGIEYVSIPEGWSVPPFSTQEVFPNNFVPLQLAIQVSPDPVEAQADKDKKGYEVILRPYSTFFKEGPYEVDPTYTFVFKVNMDPECEIIPEFPSVSIVPGQKTDVHFTLVNTGNVIDTYTLNSMFDERASKEWKVIFATGIGQPEVLPGDTFSITVKVTVPIDTARNQNVNLFVTAASAKRPGLVTTSAACTVFAAIRFAAWIEEQNTPFLVEPGKQNTLYFNFTNRGNDKDPNQEVRAVGPKGWKIAIDQSPLKTGRLGQKSIAKMTMSFFVPETSVTTDYGARSVITMSAYGGPNKLLLDTKTYFFDIPRKVKVGLISDMTTKNGFVGGQAEFLITVQNRGNYGDAFNLSCNFPWATLEMETTPPIFANDTIPIRLMLKIPNDAAADTNPDTPNVFDGYKIKVWAYSQNETRKGDTLTSLDLTLKIAPFYSFEMSLAPDEKPMRFSTDHDQVRAVSIRIKNTGNIADRVKLDFEDNPYSSWVIVQMTYIDVAYHSHRDVVLMIKPKAFTISEPRNISLNLIGVSYYDKTDPPFSTNYRFNLTFYTLIFNILDARMNNQTIDASGTPAELDKKYSFQVEVENTGAEALNPNLMSRMYVVLYDAGFEMDRANISYLKSGESKTVVFAWYAGTPGPHKLMFQLEGDLPLSERGRIVDEYNVIVKYDHWDPPEEDSISLMDFMPQIILMVIFGLGIFIFLYMFNKIFISAIDTGYDEDGTYRPWAVREKIKDDNRLDAMPVRPQLPSPAPLATSRQLPPSPAASPVTPTTAASPVAASPYQPRPAAPAQAMPVRTMPQTQPMPAQARPATPMQPMAVPRPMPAQAQPVATRPAGPIPPAQQPRPLAQPAAPPAPPRPPQPAAPRAPPVPPNPPKPPQ